MRAVAAVALLLLVAGCSGTAAPDEAVEDPSQSTEVGAAAVEDSQPVEDPEQDAEETPAEEEPAAVAEVLIQEETCDWDSPRVSGSGEVPTGQDGDLAEIIVGSWQHTHIDDGGGFAEATNDHRYVFPAPNRLLYCQDVPGITDRAENAGDITLNGTTIELPGGVYSYSVTAWNEDAMVWVTSADGSAYLLQRR